MLRIDAPVSCRRTAWLFALAFLLCVTTLPVASREPAKSPEGDKQGPKAPTDNKNSLVKKYQDKLEVTASTFWPGWAPEKLIDGQPETSWFSASGDAAAKGAKPWVQVAFPEDVTVTRVTLLGNREPDWLDNFSVLSGVVEFLDADGKPLWAEEAKAKGDRRDFEYKPKKPVKGVRSIKFTSLEDEGDKNGFDDIAIGEFLAE
jgi:hypothetical protein